MTKRQAICTSLLLIFMATAAAQAQTLRWYDNGVRSGAGSIYGDARLKPSIAFADPGRQVYVKVSGWEEVYSQRSKLVVYIWDSDNYGSTQPYSSYSFTMYPSERTYYFPVTIPRGHRFSVEVRAQCLQSTSGSNKTWTYNRLLEVYW